ncbi:MAG TPA: GDP-mannose 4,6-dehydratase, partial [Gaiellaceae bacterium]|nr:GDP-mannose 4,6-dehydratase [Gaiellaceae bacterium]
MRLLVTGGAGFIGSNFVRWLLREHDYNVINFDKLTYAGNLDNLLDVAAEYGDPRSGHRPPSTASSPGTPRYRFVQGDICDAAAVEAVMADADAVVNFAAETHVDRSLMDPG